MLANRLSPSASVSLKHTQTGKRGKPFCYSLTTEMQGERERAHDSAGKSAGDRESASHLIRRQIRRLLIHESKGRTHQQSLRSRLNSSLTHSRSLRLFFFCLNI